MNSCGFSGWRGQAGCVHARAWDCDADGVYWQRTPAEGEERRVAQEILIRMARSWARRPLPSYGAAGVTSTATSSMAMSLV